MGSRKQRTKQHWSPERAGLLLLAPSGWPCATVGAGGTVQDCHHHLGVVIRCHARGPSRGPGWLHLVDWESETAVGGGERGAEERGRGQGALPRPQARPREKFRLSTYFSVPNWLWACLLH